MIDPRPDPEARTLRWARVGQRIPRAARLRLWRIGGRRATIAAPWTDGRVEGWSGTSRPVSSPRHIEQRARISRTPPSCRLRVEGYVTYRTGRTFTRGHTSPLGVLVDSEWGPPLRTALSPTVSPAHEGTSPNRRRRGRRPLSDDVLIKAAAAYVAARNRGSTRPVLDVDGWRILAYKAGSTVRLISRNAIEHTRRFPELGRRGRQAAS